jgi:hypothetical protein
VLLNSVLDTGIHHGLSEDSVLRGIRHGLAGKSTLEGGPAASLPACTGSPQPPWAPAHMGMPKLTGRPTAEDSPAQHTVTSVLCSFLMAF